MADGKIWAFRKTAVSTQGQLVAFDIAGNQIDSITFDVDDADVLGNWPRIAANEDTVIFQGNGRAHAFLPSGEVEYEWGDYSTDVGKGISYAENVWAIFLQDTYPNTDFHTSTDGVSWDAQIRPTGSTYGFPELFWDSTNSLYYYLNTSCYENCNGYLYTTTNFSTYNAVSSSGLSGEFFSYGVILNDVLYCPLRQLGNPFNLTGFAKIDNGVATELSVSPTISTAQSICNAYIDETGAVCFDVYDGGLSEYYAYKLIGTTFTKQTSFSLYSSTVYFNYNTRAYPTTGGYVYVTGAEVSSGFRIVSPAGAVAIAADPTYPWISVAIGTGLSTIPDFWAEEALCIESACTYPCRTPQIARVISAVQYQTADNITSPDRFLVVANATNGNVVTAF